MFSEQGNTKMSKTEDKIAHKYTEFLAEKLKCMTDDELAIFFEKNTIEYDEELLTVCQRFSIYGI